MGYSFRSEARVLFCAPSHRQDSTYHSLCYTCRGALAGTKNSSMGLPWRINPTTHHTISEHSYHGATSRSFMGQRYGDYNILQITRFAFWSIKFQWKSSLDSCQYIIERNGNGILLQHLEIYFRYLNAI